MDNFDDKDRKFQRKNNFINNKMKNRDYIDEDARLASKAKKSRKNRLQDLEQEELENEWEDYFK